jgi:protein-tyrosine-phosphatase
MAEGFARAYGSDLFEAHSAGLRPASRISRRTCAVMEEKGIRLEPGHSTKHISSFRLDDFDIIVNLSEYSLPDTSTTILKRALRDPSRGDEDAFRDVREDAELLVRRLIRHYRAARGWDAGANRLYSEECAAASSPSF